MMRYAILVFILVLCGCSSQGDRQEEHPRIIGAGAGKGLTIALLGATGMVGGYVVEEALSQGYEVRALARSPQKLDVWKERLTIIEGDARDPVTIRTLLQGSDVVVSALGPVRADGDAAKMVGTVATTHILDAMDEFNISRYILVSGAAVQAATDDRNMTGWLMLRMVSLALADTLRDKQAEYERLVASQVAWTAVRSPMIKAEPYRRKPRSSLVTPESFTLRAGELARFMIDQIESEEFVQKAPFLDSL